MAHATNPRPAWLDGATRLWSEDDVGTPDRERITEAWMRLFGEPPDKSRCIEEYDGGDEFFYLMPDGRIYRYGYDGGAIYLVKDKTKD